jgi:hypothetical protein
LQAYPAGRVPAADAERVYYAALLLAVGQVDKSEPLLSSISPNSPDAPLAAALRQVINVVSTRSSSSSFSSSSSNSRRLRPLRLDGLTLTNMPNNRGQKPITNRNSEPSNLEPRTLNFESGTEFRSGQAGTQNSKQQSNKGTIMKSIACKLGLAAEASEEAVLDALTKIINRADEATQRLTTAQGRIALLETESATLLNDQIEADFAAAGIKDEKIINRHKPILSDAKHFKNRAERVEFIRDIAGDGGAGRAATSRAASSGAPQTKLHNRDTRPPTLDLDKGLEAPHRAEATKIQNRAFELLKQMPNLSTATAYTMAQAELRN